MEKLWNLGGYTGTRSLHCFQTLWYIVGHPDLVYICTGVTIGSVWQSVFMYPVIESASASVLENLLYKDSTLTQLYATSCTLFTSYSYQTLSAVKSGNILNCCPLQSILLPHSTAIIHIGSASNSRNSQNHNHVKQFILS